MSMLEHGVKLRGNKRKEEGEDSSPISSSIDYNDKSKKKKKNLQFYSKIIFLVIIVLFILSLIFYFFVIRKSTNDDSTTIKPEEEKDLIDESITLRKKEEENILKEIFQIDFTEDKELLNSEQNTFTSVQLSDIQKQFKTSSFIEYPYSLSHLNLPSIESLLSTSFKASSPHLQTFFSKLKKLSVESTINKANTDGVPPIKVLLLGVRRRRRLKGGKGKWRWIGNKNNNACYDKGLHSSLKKELKERGLLELFSLTTLKKEEDWNNKRKEIRLNNNELNNNPVQLYCFLNTKAYSKTRNTLIQSIMSEENSFLLYGLMEEDFDRNESDNNEKVKWVWIPSSTTISINTFTSLLFSNNNDVIEIINEGLLKAYLSTNGAIERTKENTKLIDLKDLLLSPIITEGNLKEIKKSKKKQQQFFLIKPGFAPKFWINTYWHILTEFTQVVKSNEKLQPLDYNIFILQLNTILLDSSLYKQFKKVIDISKGYSITEMNDNLKTLGVIPTISSKEEASCNVLSLILEKEEELKLISATNNLMFDLSLFIYRHKTLLTEKYSLIISNQIEFVKRMKLYHPNVFLIKTNDMTIVSSIIQQYCTLSLFTSSTIPTRNNMKKQATPTHSLLSNTAPEFYIYNMTINVTTTNTNGLRNEWNLFSFGQKQLPLNNILQNINQDKKEIQYTTNILLQNTNGELKKKKNSLLHLQQVPLHIALQVNDFHIFGGLERVVIELSLHLLSFPNIKVTFINCGKEGTPMEEIKKYEKKFHKIITVKNEKEYEELLINERFDFVHSHYSIYGIKLCHTYQIPFIQTVHNQYLWFFEENNLFNSYKEADKYTTLYTAVSSDVAMYSDIKLELSVDKMIIIRNGLDPNRLTSSCSLLANKKKQKQEKSMIWKSIIPTSTTIQDIDDNTFIIVQVATVAPSKGQQYLIRAFERVKKTLLAYGFKPLLVFAGRIEDHAWRKFLLRLTLQSNVREDVVFLGSLESKKISCLLQIADMMVHPSLLEGWSLAVAEGIYMKKDLVVTNVGGSGDTVEAFHAKLGSSSPIIAKVIDPPYISILNDGVDMQETPRKEFNEFVDNLASTINEVIRERANRNLLTKKKKYSWEYNRKMKQLHSSFIYDAYRKLYYLLKATGNNIEIVQDTFRNEYM
ncbi:hypothetical protein ABK040_001311 [Willaertia magna]